MIYQCIRWCDNKWESCFVTSVNQIRTNMGIHRPQELKVLTLTVRKNCTLFQFLVTHLPAVQYSFSLILTSSHWFSCLFHFIYFCTIYIKNCNFQAFHILLCLPLHISTLRIPLPCRTSQQFMVPGSILCLELPAELRV